MSKDFSIRFLLDTVQKHLRALRALQIKTDDWDLLVINLIKRKLNLYNREKWEECIGTSDIPKLEKMFSFLERRAQIESTRAIHNSTNASRPPAIKNHLSSQSSNSSRSFIATISNASNNKQSEPSQKSRNCPICKSDHAVFMCKKFLNLSPKDRQTEAERASLCLNCLRYGHQIHACRLSSCRKCKGRHNTLLHFETRTNDSQPSASAENTLDTLVANSPTNNYNIRVPSQVYLATAIVDVMNGQGRYQPCRVMLDGGAQSCTITNDCASRLRLKQNPFEIPLLSIDDMSTHIKFRTFTTIRSRFNNQKHDLELLVVNKIADFMPSYPLNKNDFDIPDDIFLADAKFNEPSPIDIIIGAEYTYGFLVSGKLHIKGHSAVLQNTVLGWIIAGRIYNDKGKSDAKIQTTICNFFHNTSLPLLWELDKVEPASIRSKEEQECEIHFNENTQRDDTGRYMVRLPFNEKLKQLGDSKTIAFQRFYSLERKFERDPLMKKVYSDCINNYLDEGHMSEVANKSSASQGYYLPHHAVVKQSSLTTKTRVVFDASMKTTTGISLNDCLKVGPNIQDDIFSIFTRFRSFQFALTADIQQMYRQVKVHPVDSIYQKILWRNSSSEPIKIFTLNRLTFGTASAPFLATRTLLKLADEGINDYPNAARVLKHDFYVDDLVTSCKSLEEALSLRNDMMELLSKGEFNLRK